MPHSVGDARLAVGLDDVDGDVAELALVLTGVVPAEHEVTPTREDHAHLGQSTAAVAVEGDDEVIGGRGRRQRLGHLAHHSLSTARTRDCGSATCTAPGWPLVFPLPTPSDPGLAERDESVTVGAREASGSAGDVTGWFGMVLGAGCGLRRPGWSERSWVRCCLERLPRYAVYPRRAVTNRSHPSG